MIPLICIDVDGTLVGSTGEVRQPVWDSVERALDRGQHLALSTARGAFASAWDMAQHLDPSGWHVFHAGGAIAHTGSGAIRPHSLDGSQLAACRELAENRGWILELYSTNAYAIEDDTKAAIDHAGLMGVDFKVSSFDEFIATESDIVRTQFVVRVEDVGEVLATSEPLGLSVTSATSPIMPGMAFVSATQSGVTKATGIQTICDELDLTIDQVMMIGDGHNDLPAIKAVGHPVAMGNAVSEVTTLSRYSVPSVDDDGVAEALDMSAELDPLS